MPEKNPTMLARMSGAGGTDEYIGTGSEVTFNSPIWGFVVSEDLDVTSVKNIADEEIGIGSINYIDSAITLTSTAGKHQMFDVQAAKMTFTGQITVIYYKA